MKQQTWIITAALAVAMVGCKSKYSDAGSNPASTANDSSMMNAQNVPSGNATASTPVVPMDTTTSTSVAPTAKPNPAKKGLKGKVTLGTEKVDTKAAMEMDKEGYYASTEVLPAFPGGPNALASFFEKNVQYPTDAADNGVEGQVKINFAVDEMGNVSGAKLVGNKVGYGLDEEAMRVFKQMPKWTAGKIKGKNVKTRYTLPVSFQLY